MDRIAKHLSDVTTISEEQQVIPRSHENPVLFAMELVEERSRDSYSSHICILFLLLFSCPECNDCSEVIDSDLDFIGNELRLWGKTHKTAGIVQTKIPDESEWRTMCFDSQVDSHSLVVVGYTLCYITTGYGMHARAEKVDDCAAASFGVNTSAIALVSRVEGVYTATLNASLTELRNILPTDGSCSSFKRSALYVSCAREDHHYQADIIVSPDASCQGRCGYHLQSSCRCDPQCETFQDCCYDYRSTCPPPAANETGTFDPSLFTCAPLDRENPDFGSVMLVSKCPGGWSDDLLRHRCEDLPSIYANPADRLHLEWPVSDDNGESFANLFCSICNGKDFDETEPWDVTYPLAQSDDTPVARIEEVEMCENRNGLGRVGKRLRACYKAIDSCPPSYTDQYVVTACKSYVNHVCCAYEGRRYKNHHCAMCNGVRADEIKPCENSASSLGQLYNFPHTPSTDSESSVLQTLWKFQETTPRSDDQRSHQRCNGTQAIFDALTKECRPLSCPVGYTLNNQSKCTKPRENNATISSICCQRQLSLIFTDVNRPDSTDATDEHNPSDISCVLDKLNLSSSNGSLSGWKTFRYLGTISDKFLLQSRSVCNMAGALNEHFRQSNDVFSVCKHTFLTYISMCSNVPSSDGTCDATWFSGKADEFTPVSNSLLTEVFFHNDQYILPTFTLHKVTYRYDRNQRAFINDEEVHVCGATVPNLQCRLVTIFPDDYSVTSPAHGSRLLHFHDSIFKQDEYIMYPDGRAQICADHNTFFVYSARLDVANITGNTMSLCAVLITFILHVRFRNLRNFHGRCIMSLCASLFFAQLLPLLSAKIPIPTGLCVMFAVISHYAWLAAFSWMTVIAVNLFAIFRPGAAPRNREWENNHVIPRLVAPSFGFGFPFVVVFLSFCLHCTNSSFSYGESSPCWISDATSNFWAFGVPVGALVTTNSSLFAATVFLACRTQRRSRKIRKRKENIRTLLKDLLLCIKIEIVMGVTWSVGFAASFLDSEALWLVFILTNSLQGVFLLLTCLCSSNVNDNLRGRRSNQIKEVIPLEGKDKRNTIKEVMPLEGNDKRNTQAIAQIAAGNYEVNC